MLKTTGEITRVMRKLRTLDEFTARYFREHPDEIDDYLTEIFQDFAEDNDTGTLLASLRMIARARGISDVVDPVGMTKQGVQKAPSDESNPHFGNIASIVRAMGYQLLPQKLQHLS
jgi:HTH-type transcriptional regulator / antitoxin HigA